MKLLGVFLCLVTLTLDGLLALLILQLHPPHLRIDAVAWMLVINSGLLLLYMHKLLKEICNEPR